MRARSSPSIGYRDRLTRSADRVKPAPAFFNASVSDESCRSAVSNWLRYRDTLFSKLRARGCRGRRRKKIVRLRLSLHVELAKRCEPGRSLHLALKDPNMQLRLLVQSLKPIV